MSEGTAIAASKPSSTFALAEPGLRMAPSLLAADFARLAEQVALVENAGAEVLHLDVMDGHFVPNISFGAPVIASIRKCSRMVFDAHLMIEDPLGHADGFVRAGCDHITFHIEVADDPAAVVDRLRERGVSVGVSLNPGTGVEAVEPVLDRVDLVLVMSVWPGFGGQAFIEDVLPKVAALRKKLKPHQRLEIDGGIDPRTIALAARAGADTFVAGTAIFRQDDPVAAMRELERIARGEATGTEGTKPSPDGA
ncbi:MAG: ribulose-phosphate 3-epimerase [Planctomycetota bacterium]|nr:MAG: ribulose-phosphate 3-epimerase [Planctomycetota bacterium]